MPKKPFNPTGHQPDHHDEDHPDPPSDHQMLLDIHEQLTKDIVVAGAPTILRRLRLLEEAVIPGGTGAEPLLQIIDRILRAVTAVQDPATSPSLYSLVQDARQAVANPQMTQTVLAHTAALKESVGVDLRSAVLASVTTVKDLIDKGDGSVVSRLGTLKTSVDNGASSALSSVTAVKDLIDKGDGSVISRLGALKTSVDGEGETSVVSRITELKTDVETIQTSVGTVPQGGHSILQRVTDAQLILNQQLLPGGGANTLRSDVTAIKSFVSVHNNEELTNLLTLTAKAVGAMKASTESNEVPPTALTLLLEVRKHFRIGEDVVAPPDPQF